MKALSKWVSKIIDEDTLRQKMASKKLRVKFWIDPTWTIIHLWHAVPLLKLRQFQEEWHVIVLIIGDSTAQVWDTSDKESERPMLTRMQTRKNAEDWLGKISKILDIDKVELHFNSEWLDKTSFNEVGELAKHFSVAEMIDRDNFSKRLKSWTRISIQEFLYPIMQWLDSVKINADVEIGWNDQYFNLMAWRKLQQALWQEKQDVITMKLLMWPDGKKMSKTGGNCIAIDDKPNDMFIKIMAVSDELVMDYFELATNKGLDEINKLMESVESWTLNIMDLKKILAFDITSFYHNDEEANNALKFFNDSISWNIVPNKEDIPQFNISDFQDLLLWKVIKTIGFHSTTWEAKNAILNWGVRIDWCVISDINYIVTANTTIQSWRKKFAFIND